MPEDNRASRTVCPKCGKALHLDSSGRIGWCSIHKEWFPVSSEYVEIAALKNEEYVSSMERTRLKAESERQAKIQEDAVKVHNRNVRTVSFSFAALLVLAAIGFFFLIRPSMIYNKATDLMMSGTRGGVLSCHRGIR